MQPLTMQSRRIVIAISIYVVVLAAFLWSTNTLHLFNRWGAVYGFATLRVLVVHLICAVPICWALIDSIARGKRTALEQASESSIVLLALLSALFTLGIYISLSPVSALMFELEVGFAVRSTIRTLLSVMAMLPIVSLIYFLDNGARLNAIGAIKIAVVTTGIYLASLYAWKQCKAAPQSFLTASNSVRLATNLRILSQLIELDSSPRALIDDQTQRPGRGEAHLPNTPKMQLNILEAQAEKLEAEIAQFIEAGLSVGTSQPATPILHTPSSITIATNLISLNRLQEAKAVLDSIPAENQDANLLRAIIAKDCQDWSYLLSIAEKLLSSGDRSDYLICSLKGDALVGLKKYSEATRFYEELYQSFDSYRPEIAIRIARLAMDQGDKYLALRYLDGIESLATERMDEVRSLRRTIATNSCSIPSKTR